MLTPSLTRRLHLSVTLLLGGLLLWELILFISPNKDSFWHIIFNVGYSLLFLFAGLTAISFGRRNNLGGARGAMMWFLGLGSLSFTIALWMWAYVSIVFQEVSPFTGVADVFFFIFTLLFACGMYCLIHIFAPILQKKTILKTVGLIVSISAIVFSFVLLPRLNLNQDFLNHFFTFSLLIINAIILSLILICLHESGGKSSTYLRLFLFSGIFLVAADFIFLYRNQVGIYWNGDISDFFYLLSGYALASGIITASEDL